jgi:diguanylate cyclase (GGDEF)-like protein
MGSRKESKSGSGVQRGDDHPAAVAFIEVLGALGRVAVEIQDADSDETLNQCNLWVGHLAEGEPAPSGVSKAQEPSWEEAQKFALSLVRRERDFAVTRFDDFRQMIWVVIQGLREAFRDDKSSDEEVTLHLDRLRTAVDSDSIDEMRNEVVAAVVMISRSIESRKKRQHLQLEELGAQLNRMRAELLRAQQELALDPMTRLYNRASFDELLKKTIELSILSGQSACLLMIDVDFFKRINDEHGHVCGDQAVLKIADCLKATFPRKTDFVARYGGDEFAVILQETILADGQMLAKRLISSVKNLDFKLDCGESWPLSVSIGVADMGCQDDPTSWISRADRALYKAKDAGRGCVCIEQAKQAH